MCFFFTPWLLTDGHLLNIIKFWNQSFFVLYKICSSYKGNDKYRKEYFPHGLCRLWCSVAAVIDGGISCFLTHCKYNLWGLVNKATIQTFKNMNFWEGCAYRQQTFNAFTQGSILCVVLWMPWKSEDGFLCVCYLQQGFIWLDAFLATASNSLLVKLCLMGTITICIVPLLILIAVLICRKGQKSSCGVIKPCLGFLNAN